MRKNLLLMLSMFVGFGLFAQGYEQDFDGFTAGDYLAEVDTDWTTWSVTPGTAEDPTISDAFAATAPNSVFVSGTNDAVYPCGDLTSGAYVISFDMYVPTDRVGYFNVQQVFGADWAMSLTFMPGGDITVSAGGLTPTGFTFTPDTWFPIEVRVNLNDDIAQCLVDGVEVVEWQYSLKEDGAAGTLALGCVNMYAYDGGNGSTPEYYFDNFMFDETATVLYSEDFDDFAANDYLAVVDPENWTTWSVDPGSAEDPIISDAFAATAPNSVFVSGTNDAVFPCGNLTSGSYAIAFDMYVPTDRVGYFNVQQAFGVDWSMSMTFMPGGDITVAAGGLAPTGFTFTPDTWFPIEVYIDLNEDIAQCIIDGVEVVEWQFSLTETGTPAEALQLGCVNMYASDGGNSSTPEYYFDNFEFTSTSSALIPPTVVLDTDEIVALIVDGTAVTETFVIDNVGQQNLSYNVYPTYDVAAAGTATNTVAQCGEFDGGVGYTDAISAKAASLLTPELLAAYIGTEITSIEIYVADEMAETSILVLDKGATTIGGPGEIIYEQDFTTTIGAWNTVELDTPILITGEPIYIGISYFQPAGLFSMGSDFGPKLPGINWRMTGVAWGELGEAVDRNYAIRAIVTGDPQVAWMDVPVDFGMIPAGGSETVGVFINPDGLANGQYTGSLVVAANDPNTNYTEIDVTLDILIGTDELNTLDAVSVYPNPTNDVVFVKADAQIEQVVVSNYLGQVVDIYTSLGNNGQINVSQLDNGVYFLEVTTTLAKHTIKVIKK